MLKVWLMGPGLRRGKNRKNFLNRSPADHFAILTPKLAKKILKKYGFQIKATRITGHHGERFWYRFRDLFLQISKILGLGDTFEIYACKVSEI